MSTVDPLLSALTLSGHSFVKKIFVFKSNFCCLKLTLQPYTLSVDDNDIKIHHSEGTEEKTVLETQMRYIEQQKNSSAIGIRPQCPLKKVA